MESENNLDTYLYTVGKECVKVSDKITLEFNDPVYDYNNVFEVFPNMNIPRINKDEYEMQLYYNLVKGMARRKGDRINLKKDRFKMQLYYGINIKDVYVKDNKIALINSIEYPILNDALAYIVAQLLYENIENKPFTLEINLEQERQIKELKYYLSRCYHNVWHLVREYLLCNTQKLTKRFNKLEFNNLRQVEMEMKRK